MTVDQIAMPVEQAREAFQYYRDAVRAPRKGTQDIWRKADVALARGYRALSKGKRIIDLHAAFTRAGLREDFYPKLAISRASESSVYLSMDRDGSARFIKSSWSRERGVRLPPGTLPTYTPSYVGGKVDRPMGWLEHAETNTPLVPPQFRPAHDLSGYHILWEVDEWKPAPSRDPMLLKHLGGALYVVLATWDLSPLELAVLRHA